MFSPKFKAKAPPGTGVWTPKNQTPNASTNDLDCTANAWSRLGTPSSNAPTPPPPPVQAFWTPQASPTYGRKEFRPVRFESPTLPRRYTAHQQQPHRLPLQQQMQQPWSNVHTGPGSPPLSVNSCTLLSTPTTANSDYAETDCSTFAYKPSPCVSDKIKTFERSASTSELQRPFTRRQLANSNRPAYRPNEVIYKVKHEYLSEPETENERPRKMAQLGRRQYDGIGPVTNDGMPIILRSEVKAPHQHEWYKRLYQTIHRQKNGDDFVIRYKCPRARPQYKSNGYQSEPEHTYDSDYSTLKYKTYNPHRHQSVSSAVNVRSGVNLSQNDKAYSTMPNVSKSSQSLYKSHPGRIEDYITGQPYTSDKEKKEWWDEVMDIFNGWLREYAAGPRIFIEYASDNENYVHLEQSKLSPHYTEGNLSRALAKESGYNSDSNIVFRKKEVPLSSPLSPVEQKQAYKSLQAGGEPPLLGFRKPAPEKPKEIFEEFDFIQITPTLTKICVKNKAFDEIDDTKTFRTHIEDISEESKMSSQFSKNLPSFIPLSQKKHESQPPPPQPPNRKSSCTKTTIRVSTRTKPSIASRHEQCFFNPEILPNKYGTVTLRKHMRTDAVPICRSKSAGAVSTLLTTLHAGTNDNSLTRLQKHHSRLRSVSPTSRQPRLFALRKSSRSPVAFGRSISKERTFAEEKKRLESTLPPNRTNFEASTNILRDPSLKSPQDVKEAVRSYATCNAHARSKSLPRLRHIPKSSYTTVNTTMRHTMCFPQIRPQNGGTLEYTQKQSRKKGNTLPKTHAPKTHSPAVESKVRKVASQESLPRTNSTFSIDSMVKQEITISPNIRPSKNQSNKCEIKTNRGKGMPLQNSRSDSQLGYKPVGSKPSPNHIVTKSSDNPTRYTSKTYMQYTIPYASEETTYSESVREKADFWNKCNAHQEFKSLTTHERHHQNGQHIPVQSSDLTYCSLHNMRSPNPQRYELVQQRKNNEYDNSMTQKAKCIEDLVWQYEHNSKPSMNNGKVATVVTDIARPQSPQPENARRFSPTREVRVPQTTRNLRSPSRRRIESCRSLAQSKGDVNAQKVIRASSLSSADDRSKRGLYLCGDLAHSATSLTYLERHSPTCRYRNNSERFTDLNRFYNTLERVGQLERATSETSFKPIRKDSELLDFDEWRKVRLHERAEKELHYLVDKLKNNQREKDMIFRSKDVEDVKWRIETDIGLHSKEKSVEDLRENFEQINLLKNSENYMGNDYSRTHWRRNTVADLASSFHQKFNTDANASIEDASCHLNTDLVSTLSTEQIKKVSKQLNEIYSLNCQSARHNAPVVSEKYVVTVQHGVKPSYHANTIKVRSNSSITKEDLFGPVLRKKEFKNSVPESHKREVEQKFLDQPAQSNSPVLQTSETRSVIAIKNAALPQNRPPKVPLRSKPLPPPTSDPLKKEDRTQKLLDISREKGDNISQKIQYFEERQYDEPPKVVYHAREDSSPDEGEVMRIIEENMKVRARESYQRQHKELSNSLTDIGDIFGERHTSRVNFQLHQLPQRPPDRIKDWDENKNASERSEQTLVSFDVENTSQEDSIEYYDAYYRSPCLSPQSETCSTFLQDVYTGDVQKIKEKFESIGQQQENQAQPKPTSERHNFFGLSSLRRVRSDPEFNIHLSAESKDTLALKSETASTTMHTMPCREEGWFLHKVKFRNPSLNLNSANERGRRRQRGAISPSLMRNRFMPHIDIISKSAALNLPSKPTRRPSSSTRSQSSNSGIVERIRSRYEPPKLNEIGFVSTSNPDLRNAHVTPPHLTADWIAHKFPNPMQNDLAYDCDIKSVRKLFCKTTHCTRSSSTSPPRPPKSLQHPVYAELSHSLRPCYDDIFANQKFDPKVHQPKARYVPDGIGTDNKSNTEDKHSTVGCNERFKRPMAVTFKDYDYSAPPIPPQPPIKGVSFDEYDTGAESPNRYYDTDVNIHFKTPIKHECKQNIPEEKLAIRQAEQMQQLYQEERRRKYLQELQDMNSRRHTDNFTQSQKSPIPLNRYDDFPTDVTLKTLIGPKTVARALYNFKGQSSKELSIRKNDIIYIRRQIDSNWYEGEHNAMIGLLPVNYVEIISKDGARPQLQRPSEGQARAKYNFQAQSGVELSLNKGELITLTRRVDDNWFEGKIANRKGIFPVSYVEVLTDIGAEDIAARTTVINSHSTTNLRPSLESLRTNINNEFNAITQNGAQPPNGILKETRQLHKTDALHVDTSSEPLSYRALYKYRPQNSDELELLEGDLVHVLEKCDDGWFVGTSQRTGCFGTFPGNYVERV